MSLKPQELSSLGADELKDKANQLRKELMQFRFQQKTGKLEKQSSIRDTKRDIARILTAISQKKSEAKS
jgi:large subunit ribosomal protein L29